MVVDFRARGDWYDLDHQYYQSVIGERHHRPGTTQVSMVRLAFGPVASRTVKGMVYLGEAAVQQFQCDIVGKVHAVFVEPWLPSIIEGYFEGDTLHLTWNGCPGPHTIELDYEYHMGPVKKY